jgi:hypothetical protein
MYKKITVLVLMLASLVIFLPSTGNAATGETTGFVKSATELNASPSQVRVQIGNRRPRRRVIRRIYRRPVVVRRAVRRPRVRQQVYYRNGRRYVRTVRVY